jgi:E3 ubiquitin-protein ligase synoviolin
MLANVVLMRAYYERPNFYSAAVYISQSTGSLMFLINLGLIVTASFGYGLQRLFYGPLRPIETEQLYDKAWFAVSETLMAMTIFRDDIGLWFFAMFLCLLAGKLWQWIGEGRVEFLEQQPPANPKLFHARLMSSLVLSVVYDVYMTQYCIDAILSDARAGVMVMFGFEYVLLAIASVSTLLRYTLSLVELLIVHRQETTRDEAQRLAREARRPEQAQAGRGESAAEPAAANEDDDDDDDVDVPGWEEKGRWVFYLDLTTDFIKSVVYIGFFMILMAFYGIPIHIMRDLFMTLRSFFKRVHDFMQYRNATRDMNARYPDATAEELERENTCIVCREEMRPWVQPGEDAARPGRRVDERQRAKKLPCGHILHFGCLRSWLERQQVCPTCRRPVLSQPVPANNAQPNQPQNPGLPGQVQPAPGQHEHAPQPGMQGGQRNPPQGNMRVFNFGPIRIALGNLRLPPPNQQQQGNANNGNNDQNAIANLAQQLVQNQRNQQQTVQNQLAMPTHNGLGLVQMPAFPGAIAQHPNDIQTDILRIQQNIIESLRQLNAQQTQLTVMHSLLAELNRIQQATGVAAATGQDLPPIMPLNAQNALAAMTPQAYFANGAVLRQGDAGLPEGVVLPEGWTLRPMALAPRPGSVAAAPATVAGPSTNMPALTTGSPPPPTATTSASSQPEADPSSTQPSSSSAPQPDTLGPSSGPASTSKAAEPRSLESSWSFGNTPDSTDAEGSASSSAIAGSSASSSGQTVTKRTVTVEDAEDEGQ